MVFCLRKERKAYERPFRRKSKLSEDSIFGRLIEVVTKNIIRLSWDVILSSWFLFVFDASAITRIYRWTSIYMEAERFLSLPCPSALISWKIYILPRKEGYLWSEKEAIRKKTRPPRKVDLIKDLNASPSEGKNLAWSSEQIANNRTCLQRVSSMLITIKTGRLKQQWWNRIAYPND